LRLVVSHHHLTAKIAKPQFLRYAELLSIEQKAMIFPDVAQNDAVSYLQSTLSHNRVILVRKVHNCIMDRGTSSSIVNLYKKLENTLASPQKTFEHAITAIWIARTFYLFIIC
jgi:hypothetical protein